MKNTRPLIKQEVRNLYRVNPVSCRINRLLISYLISKQARLKVNIKSVLVKYSSQMLHATCYVRKTKPFGMADSYKANIREYPPPRVLKQLQVF